MGDLDDGKAGVSGRSIRVLLTPLVEKRVAERSDDHEQSGEERRRARNVG